MHSRDRLHVPSVAMAEAAAVDGLHAADIGVAVSGQRYLLISRQAARHAGAPEQFIAQLGVGELVYVTDDLERFPGAAERRCNELEQRF